METAHKFGRDGHLAGVVCRPERAAATDVVVVIPNAGFIHHVGPWQLHVDLARQLAAAGFPSLRFDLSGLGDSEQPRRKESVSARKHSDLRDAMGLATAETGARRVVMAGLCSGAVDSHLAALAEEQVSGAVLLDPPAYPDRLFHLLYWAERVLNPARVLRYLRRTLGASGDPVGPAGAAPAPGAYRPMSAEVFASQIEETTGRGVDYLFVYAGNGDYKHRRQLFSILTPETPLSRVTVYYYRNLEHTPVLIEDRRIIADTLINWLREKFS